LWCYPHARLDRAFPGNDLDVEVSYVEHHLVHLASAFIVSTFEDAPNASYFFIRGEMIIDNKNSAIESSVLNPCGIKVSIITVCHNSSATIRETIESVLSQDYPSIEYVIVDGYSSDGTMDIIREYRDSIDVLISEPDKGIYDAMNKGIQAATGEIIGILNSDDFYVDSTCVRRLIECMQAAGTDTVFADLVIVDSNNTERVIRYYDSGRFCPERLRYGWMPAHPTFYVKRALFETHGYYSLNYHIAADFEMVVRLLYSAGASYIHLPKVIVKMRQGGRSTSGLKSSWLLNLEIVKACRANGIDTSLWRLLLKIPVKLLEYIRKPA